MKKKYVLKKKYKVFLILLLVLFLSSSFASTSFARYVSNADVTNEIRVAKYGDLTLVEKLDGVIQDNKLDSNTSVSTNIPLGENIDKEVYIEFNNSEISAYLFLVVETVNWNYDDNLKEFSILNNGAKLLLFNIKSDWIFLNDLSSPNKYVFYYEYDVNNMITNKIEVMNQIETGMISYNDLEVLNNDQINFQAYSIQKHDGLTVGDSWDYLNIE